MATYNKFQDFVEQLAKGVHVFGTHTFKVALTNTAPVATQTSLDTVTNHPAPAAANGYTAGGNTLSVTISETTGTATIVDDATTFTAAGGNLGPFRYAILYNDTATSPADALVAWWDYGSSVTLATGETFKVSFNNDDTDGTIFTLA
jgi:hypothetical protein